MKKIVLSFRKNKLEGKVELPASKSLTNRVLIIRALSEGFFNINNLSDAADSQTLLRILQAYDQGEQKFDAGHAGTTFRFLTAFLSIKNGTQILTGSERMQQRPIGPLVDALRQVGANIEYLKKEGYPPLRIQAPEFNGNNRVSIPAGISSQFLSALLLIAPYLPKGLILEPEGKMVSSSYLKMTIAVMQKFGVDIVQAETTIQVPQGGYLPKNYTVESDWSAASYFFGMATGVAAVDLFLPRLKEDSLQGDQAIVGLAAKFGVGCRYADGGVYLSKEEGAEEELLDIDFLEFPDLAQTVMVMMALTQKSGFFVGLETLKIKETNRIEALQKELKKVGFFFTMLPPKFSPISGQEVYTINGTLDLSTVPSFETYEDHRMAMAFAMLATQGAVEIEAPAVVAKSFPEFWHVLRSLGFNLTQA